MLHQNYPCIWFWDIYIWKILITSITHRLLLIQLNWHNNQTNISRFLKDILDLPSILKMLIPSNSKDYRVRVSMKFDLSYFSHMVFDRFKEWHQDASASDTLLHIIICQMFLQKFKQIAENYMQDSKQFILRDSFDQCACSSLWIVLLLKNQSKPNLPNFLLGSTILSCTYSKYRSHNKFSYLSVYTSYLICARVSSWYRLGEEFRDDPQVDVNNGDIGIRRYYDVSSRLRGLVYVRLVTQSRNVAHAPCLDCLSDSVARASINNTTHVYMSVRM